MNSIKFVRFGGLSPVNHKKFYKQDTYHSPPCKKGIYAFIYPYIEPFLFAWKIKDCTNSKSFSDYYRREKRIFDYTGYIWTHWINEARKEGCIKDIKKEWCKIHTDNLSNLLKKVKHCDIKQLRNGYTFESNIHDPYKRGLGGNMSMDHLEVFIERVK